MTWSDLPKFSHLRVFQSVAELQSVSRASTVHRLSQPAVTHAIKQLEVLFEADLFNRQQSGSYLTDLGDILLARVNRMFAELDMLLTDLGFAEPQLSAQINRITAAQIRAQLAVAERQSFILAAQAVGTTEATMRRSLRELEKTLGTDLYERSSGGPKLTKAGLDTARRLRLATRELEYATEEISAARGQSNSRISIGILQLSSTYILAQVINELKKAHPHTKVQIFEGHYVALVEDLRSGRIDFLFGMVHSPDWASDVAEQPLFYNPYVVAVRKEHPLTRLSRITLDDLGEYEWITTEPGSTRRKAFERLFEGHKRPIPLIETTSHLSHRSLLLTSDRISLLARHDLDFESFGLLCMLPLEFSVPRPPDAITIRVNWQPPEVQKRFLDILHEITAVLREDSGLSP